MPPTSRYAARLFSIALTCFALAMATAATPATGQISGVVFSDGNGNGLRETSSLTGDPGQPSVAVRAVGDGRTWGPVLTGRQGEWQLPVPDGARVRLEIGPLDPGWWPTFARTDSAPITDFVTAPATGLTSGIHEPSQHCNDNPLIATPCYVFGPSPGALPLSDDPALIAVPWQSPDGSDASDLADKRVLATWAQVGAVYGVAVDQASGDYFAAAYVKRHAGLRHATGTIFRLRRSADSWEPPIEWATVPGAGADPHTPESGLRPWVFDSLAAFDAVGRRGLGDLDASPDGSELYVVNLANRSLHVLATASAEVSDPIPIPSPPDHAAGDWRPFGVGVDSRSGDVYVGGVVSAESTVGGISPLGDRGDLAAAVFRFDPTSRTFEPDPVLEIDDLAFARKCVRRADNDSIHDINNEATCAFRDDARWNPWIDAVDFDRIRHSNHPQPMLSDIEFQDGEMVIGMRDRTGDQLGNATWGPQWENGRDDRELYQGQVAGAVYRAFPRGDGRFVLEDDAANPVTGDATGGAGSGEGPGGGSWYYGDNHFHHDHVALGSVAVIPGHPDLAATVVNPFDGRSNTYDGGLGWFSGSGDDVGRRTRSVRLFDGVNTEPDLFGKANGLGDLAPYCALAPLQIGNRIWIDSDRDGLQDSDEEPLPGVQVDLLDEGVGVAAKALASTTTDARGLWYFDQSNVPGGLQPEHRYAIRVEPGQAPLAPYTLTIADAGDDEHDSDARPLGINGAQISARTGAPGQNDHSFDIGWVLATSPPPPVSPPPSTPPPSTPPTPTPPPTAPPPSVVPPTTKVPNTRVVVRKVARRRVVRAGSTVVWDIHVRNRGRVAARRVIVSDAIPSGMALLRVARRRTVSGRTVWKPLRFRVSGGRVIWGLGTIAPGKTERIRVWMRVGRGVRGSRTNRVTVRGPNFPPADDSSRVRLRPPPLIVRAPPVTG